jgi:drug/metabolite transporter (DMT)-like permease
MNVLLLLILGVIWGSSYLLIKVAVADVPALTLVAGRLTLATLIMGSFLRILGLSMPRDRRMWQVYLVLGLLNTALPYSLISWGEQHIPSVLAALLSAVMPILTVILVYFFGEDEKVSLAKIGGVIIGFAGVGLLILPELDQGIQASFWGQLAVASASLSYAGAAIYARRRLRGEPPLLSTTGQLTTGMLLMVPLSLIFDRPFSLSPSVAALASWLGLVIFGTVIAYILYFVLIERTSATFVSLVTYIIPISGLVFGALVLDEALNISMVGSLALILLGVLLVRR